MTNQDEMVGTCSKYGEIINAHKILVETPQGKETGHNSTGVMGGDV
jgi:hypothetical protein